MLDRDLFELHEPAPAVAAPREMRAYQVEGIAQLRDKLRQGLKRIVFYLPTGGGKTEVAGDIFKNAAGKGKRALFVCHRIELVKNASERFTSLGIGHGIIQGENTRSTWQGILVCSIQTLTRRMVEDVDLIIVDEAHRCAASRDYHKLFAKFNDKPIIGLTATPFAKGMARACEGVNGPLFEDMVIAATIPELIRDGFLVDCDIYGPSEPDLSGVKIVAGDYHQEQLGKAVDQPKLVGDIVTHWQKLGRSQQTICFATNVAHSKHITEEFQKAGVAAAHIDAYTPEFERVRIIKAFRTGEVTVLSNVGVLSEGFDCLDDQTEILTARGWRGRGDVRAGEYVYSLNRQTGTGELVPVQRVVEREVEATERMLTIRSQHANIRTTESHEFHVKYVDPNTRTFSKNFITRNGTELAARKSPYALPLCVEAKFPGLPLSHDELRLIAWFMTDGGFERHALCVSQAKAFHHEIRALLTRLGLSFSERCRGPRAGSYPNAKPLYVFRVPKGAGFGRNARAGWQRYEQYLDKGVSPLLHQMNREQFRVFWDELMKGDGAKQAGRSGWLWCDRKSQADAYTEMAVTRGFSASYSIQTTKAGREMYLVSVREKQWLTSCPGDSRAGRVNLDEASPGERVWCVTNRNGTIVTRRGGKIAVVGNCPAAAVMILARPTKSLILYIQMAGRVLRPSAGKKCLARGTLVLTDRGEVEIQNITLDHKLWDGHTFVRHDGAICNGIKRVMSYDGIVATPDHEVMTDEGWQYLAEAHRRGLRITRSGMDGRPLRVLENCLSGSRGGELQSARDGAMWPLQERPHGPISQHAKAPQYRGLSPLQWQGAGNGAALAVSAVPSATIALSEQVRRAISLVRWAWDRVSLRWAERCGAVDSGRSGHCGSLYAVGPHKQQWPLRAWKSSVGGTGPERQQQPTCGQRGETQVPDVQGGPSRGPVRRQNSFAHDPRRVVGRGNTGPMAGPVVQTEGEVWDILNVGPLQRFTANGRLVHNCALILDHSGTARRLGFPTDELPLELDDGKPKVNEGGSREKATPLPKLCSKCSFLKPAKVHTCPVCGFKPERQSEVESEDGDLKKMSRGPKKTDMTPAEKAQFFAELKGLAAERGKSNGWVLANFKNRTGHWPHNKNSIAAQAPSQATRDWVKSRQIAWAKSRSNPANDRPVFDRSKF